MMWIRFGFSMFDYADVWFRDYGPIFVRNAHELAMVHWQFNSWGQKYEELMKDALIPNVINQQMDLTCFEPGIVLEGGSIDVNGKGTLLTTEQCLLNKNRNSCIAKEDIEKFCRITWASTMLFGLEAASQATIPMAMLMISHVLLIRQLLYVPMKSALKTKTAKLLNRTMKYFANQPTKMAKN